MASQELGELGPKQSKPVIVNWRWYYNLYGLAVWIVLVLALVTVRVHRSPQALLVLLPLIIVNLLWVGFVRLLPFQSSQREMFMTIFQPMSVGLAVLWLLGDRLGMRRRWVTFLLAVIIMALVVLVGAAAYGLVELSGQALQLLIFPVIMALVVLTGLALAAWRCRRFYSKVRFMLWLAAWCLIVPITFWYALMAIMLVFQPGLRDSWEMVVMILLIQIPIIGAVLGVICYVLLFPFMMLAFKSPFFYERFYACLRLKSMPAAVVPDTGPAGVDHVGISPPGGEDGP